jgi:hypothetical protein
MRIRIFRTVVLLAVFIALHSPKGMSEAASDPTPQVQLDIHNAGPRSVEDTLQHAIRRDYARAWQTLDQALSSADPAVLQQYWTGIAQKKMTQLIKDQSSSGVRLRYIDHGHQLQTTFYALDGAAMLLRDRASLELQVYDGDRLIHSQPMVQNYVVLMTPAQDRWMVRVLEGTSEQ